MQDGGVVEDGVEVFADLVGARRLPSSWACSVGFSRGESSLLDENCLMRNDGAGNRIVSSVDKAPDGSGGELYVGRAC